MKKFDYLILAQQKFDVDLINLLTAIHEYKGKQTLFIKQNPDKLDKLTEVAMIQSTDASNKIEGIYTSDERLREIVKQKVEPQTRDEQEISGYRDVLAIIHEAYANIEITTNNVLTLHNRLYTYLDNNFAGRWKNSDNVIEERDADGHQFVRFQPAPAYLTAGLMTQLVEEYQQVIDDGQVDPLLVIPAFVFDFVSIHPFRDGNGRMSRLLTLLLLYKSGYVVGQYISLEKLIEDTKETYYDVLQQSSIGWWDNQQDYVPFMRYLLGIIYKAYTDFENRFAIMQEVKLTPADRIARLLNERLVPISKSDIIALLPDISEATIKRAIQQLIAEQKIVKVGAARATKYRIK